MTTAERITWIVCGTIAFLAIVFLVWYALAVNSPGIAIVRMEMDNNTLEAMRFMYNSSLI